MIMTKDTILALLDRKTNELNGGLPIEWHYPDTPLANPLRFQFDKSWARYENNKAGSWTKHGRNWLYAEITFPEVFYGVPLVNEQAMLFINGAMPFTLWLDGRELFREEHVWHATGPIADPFPVPIVPGRRHELVLCVEPTELPCNSLDIHVEFKIHRCTDLALETGSAAAQLRYAAALADTPADKACLDKAVACLDAKALATERWERFLSSIRPFEEVLAPFAARAREMTVHLIGHTHIDMDFKWTWSDTVKCIRRDCKAAANLMDAYPDLTFTLSQIPIYDTLRRKDPSVFRRAVQRIREGRWECAASTWVEGDLNMADGEAIARHMLYAADWAQAHLGTQARVLWEPDTFGHPGNMPQLARLGECDAYFHWRCNPDKFEGWPVWQWVGIDGTPITCFSEIYGSDLSPQVIASRVLRHLRDGRRHALHVWGIGDHGGGLSRWQLENLQKYIDKPVMPTVEFSTIARLLEAVRKENPKLPTAQGQTYSLFEGCFTTHAHAKADNRKCEGALLVAEALAALAGQDHTAVLRDAWTPALFNQFHDILDGAAVHDSYVDARKRAASSLRRAAAVTKEALRALVRPTADAGTLMVVNPLGFERTEPVRATLPPGTTCLVDADGRAVPVQKLGREFVFIASGIPAFSRKTYRILATPPEIADISPVATMENGEYVKVETPLASLMIHRESGYIGSYFHKGLGRELVSYGISLPLTHVPSTHAELALNVFQFRDEALNWMTAWLINDILREENLLRGATVRLLATGPVFARFRVIHTIRSSTIEEDILVYRDFPRLDFEARIDWRERVTGEHGVPQLKISFAGAISAPCVRTEGPFAIREIPADGMEMPTQKWSAVSGREFGFALYNDSRYGMDALGPRMRITLVRNGSNPDPETDNGRHVVRFAYEPHAPGLASPELVRRGMAFNRPLITALSGQPLLTFAPQIQIHGAETVICTALRRAEHSGDLLVRLFQADDHPARATIGIGRGIATVVEVNFLENPTGGNIRLAGGMVTLSFRPFEVKTLLVRIKGWQEEG